MVSVLWWLLGDTCSAIREEISSNNRANQLGKAPLARDETTSFWQTLWVWLLPENKLHQARVTIIKYRLELSESWQELQITVLKNGWWFSLTVSVLSILVDWLHCFGLGAKQDRISCRGVHGRTGCLLHSSQKTKGKGLGIRCGNHGHNSGDLLPSVRPDLPSFHYLSVDECIDLNPWMGSLPQSPTSEHCCLWGPGFEHTSLAMAFHIQSTVYMNSMGEGLSFRSGGVS